MTHTATTSTPAKGVGARPRWRFRQQREPERFMAYLFIAPSLLLLTVFRFYPLVRGAYYALTEWDGYNEPVFVGLQNFVMLFTQDDLFRAAIANTVKLLLTLPIWVIFPMILAVLIHQEVPGWRFFRAAYFFPCVLSAVIVGSIFNMVLRIDGPLNSLLRGLGLRGLALDWLGHPTTALPAIISVAIWASFGTGVIVFLAGLGSVPPDLFDAAKIDGASWLQTLWYVTIPVLRPVIEFVAVTASMGMLTSLFGYVYVMTGGGPGTATYLPEYLIWNQQGMLNRPGYASAISITLFFILFVIAAAQVRLMARAKEN
jgi:multiple sugar transport system permease protein